MRIASDATAATSAPRGEVAEAQLLPRHEPVEEKSRPKVRSGGRATRGCCHGRARRRRDRPRRSRSSARSALIAIERARNPMKSQATPRTSRRSTSFEWKNGRPSPRRRRLSDPLDRAHHPDRRPEEGKDAEDADDAERRRDLDRMRSMSTPASGKSGKRSMSCSVTSAAAGRP